MSKVTKSIIRTVIEQAINRYDNSRNKEEIIDELSSVFESSIQYYEEHWEEKDVPNFRSRLLTYMIRCQFVPSNVWRNYVLIRTLKL